MSNRSLQASSKGIQKANRALIRCSLTQKALAADLGITRQPVGKFFKGERVDRNVFVQICERLDLDWEEITQPLFQPANNLEDDSNIDSLVQEIRQKWHTSIQKRCGEMRILDMSQPMELDDIYTNVNVLERITGRQRLEIVELSQDRTSEDFNRFDLSHVREKRVPGLEAVELYDKLVILGKPGAGKTTFLKRLATLCNKGSFQPHLVPIFITLKDFAEAKGQPGLLEYVDQQFTDIQIQDPQATELLLRQGRLLILLDGLDEVQAEDNKHVLQEIRNFAQRFRDNLFVMSCRIAAHEYAFQQFTEVEIADFDDQQISNFATKWFEIKTPHKAGLFLKKLEENSPIQELATNPLLLTLLCLVFEGATDFPTNRSELYEEGVDVLLKKWDGTRSIERDQIYKKLSLKRKEDLLSQLALTTFEQGSYFFKQRDAERHIIHYIQNLPDAQTDSETLHLDSEAILKSIEAQHGLLVERAHGIYSFSHLTFHEYFAARQIKEYDGPEVLQRLVCHVTEKRWREVFLLTICMLPNADKLLGLIKQQVDQLAALDVKVQGFLVWLNQKSLSVTTSYKPEAVRAFYLAPNRTFEHTRDFDLTHDLTRDLDLADALTRDRDLTLDLTYDRARDPDLALDLALTLDFDLARALARARTRDLDLDPTLNRDLDIARARAFARAHDQDRFLDLNHALVCALDSDPAIARKLQRLKNELPSPSDNRENRKQWWLANGLNWVRQLRTIMVEHRNIGHDWQFTDQQKTLLKEYYNGNKLLVDCLNSDCYVSREVREEIKTNLLLPIAEIEKNFPNQRPPKPF